MWVNPVLDRAEAEAALRIEELQKRTGRGGAAS
jgi:hypothetical protein